jgi:GAF domain-containing protein
VFDEQRRLDEVQRYDVLDSEREDAFDQLAALAAHACETPSALISIVDERRVWHKALHGPAGELRHELYLEVLRSQRVVVVEELFFAGTPLVTPRGLPLGTLSVHGPGPRPLAPPAERCLQMLADRVMQALEDRRQLLELRRAESMRQEAVEALLATKADLEARIELRTREVAAAHEKTRSILARVADGFVALEREWRFTAGNGLTGKTG